MFVLHLPLGNFIWCLFVCFVFQHKSHRPLFTFSVSLHESIHLPSPFFPSVNSSQDKKSNLCNCCWYNVLKLSFTLQQLITLVNYFNYSQGNAPGTEEDPTGLQRHKHKSRKVSVYSEELRWYNRSITAWVVKPEQGRLGLDLQISVCGMERFIGGGLRGRQILQDSPWTGLLRLGDATPAFPSWAEMMLSVQNGTATWRCSNGQHLCDGRDGYVKEEIKSSKLSARLESWGSVLGLGTAYL